MYCICDKVSSETELTIQNAQSYITVYTHIDTITLTQTYTYIHTPKLTNVQT